MSWQYFTAGAPFLPDQSPIQSASSPLLFGALDLSHLVWQFLAPNNSFKPMRTLQEILQSTSDALFPAELGEREVCLDSQDCDGDTPLHVLVWRGDSAGAKALIAAGAAPDASGDMGETPLHVAVRQENSGLVEALLEAGANPDIRSEFGETPREMAAAKGGAVAGLLGRAAPNSSFKPNPLRGSA